MSAEEQEVDLGRWWSAVVARWWLPVLGLLVGAFLGYVIALGGKEVWNASANVYLGASYGPSGIFLQGPQSNPSAAGTIARAQSTIEAAAAQAGMPESALRGNIATESISTGNSSSLVRTTGNPLVKITVQASTRRRAAAAANAVGDIVVERLAGYADSKIALLKTRIASEQKELETLRRGAANGDPTSRAVLGVQVGAILNDQLQSKQFLVQAQQVERPQVLTRAAAVKTTARSRRNSVVVGGFLGLVLGLIAALVWEPVVRRARR